MGGGLMGMVRSGYYDCIIGLKQPMYNAFPTDKNEHIRMILYVLNDYDNFQHKHYIYALQ